MLTLGVRVVLSEWVAVPLLTVALLPAAPALDLHPLPFCVPGGLEALLQLLRVGDFRVLAGSPENQGPVEFTVQALPADVLRSVQSGEYARNYVEQRQRHARVEQVRTKRGKP